MILADVNVLVYAFRSDAQRHSEYRAWLLAESQSDRPFAISDLILSGFLRIVTNPRVFARPEPLDSALAFVESLRGLPTALVVHPGPRHWDIFVRLCRQAAAHGNLISDAYLAALAIESGSEWVTADRDFARFPGLRWRHPLGQA